MLFESGMTLDHKKKYYLLKKMLTMQQAKRLKHKAFTFEDDNYSDITFDVIKRGPLLLLLIGLPIACVSFAIEFYSRYSRKKATSVELIESVESVEEMKVLETLLKTNQNPVLREFKQIREEINEFDKNSK